MSKRLNPDDTGESVTLGVRFDRALVAVIDGERARLEALTGEPCDRSRALRNIVRRYGATVADASSVPQPATTDATSTKPPAEEKASPSVASTPTSSPRKPTAGRWETVSASDLRRLAKDLAALSTEEFNRIRDGAAGVKRAAVYDAKKGKAGRQVHDMLRAYLDRGAKP